MYELRFSSDTTWIICKYVYQLIKKKKNVFINQDDEIVDLSPESSISPESWIHSRSSSYKLILKERISYCSLQLL